MPLPINISKLENNYNLLIKNYSNENYVNLNTYRFINKNKRNRRNEHGYPSFSELRIECEFINNYSDIIDAIIKDQYIIRDNLKEGETTYMDPNVVILHLQRVARWPRNIHFVIFMSIESNVNSCPCNDDVQIPFVNLPQSIRNPPKHIFGSIKYDPVLDVVSKKYRYINNFNVQELINQCKGISASLEKGDMEREAHLYLKYVFSVLNQSRSISLSSVVLSLFYSSTCSVKDQLFIHRCKQCYSPFFRYFQDMFINYIRWPFFDNPKGMLWDMSVISSSSLVPLLYALCHREVSYITGVISVGYFNLCMHNFYEWGTVSFSDLHLDQKGKMNKVTKLLHERLKNDKVPIYMDNNVVGVREIGNIREYWYKDEKEELLNIIDNINSTRTYFNHIKFLLTLTFSINELISHIMALECSTNPSDFKKSTPVLEYERSVKPIVNVALFNTLEKEEIMNIPITNCFTGILSEMYEHVSNSVKDALDTLKYHDFLAEYYARLTNNSSGMTRESLDKLLEESELAQNIPDLPTYSRYISALLQDYELNDEALTYESVARPSKSGKREQNDRRSRFIMMVPNAYQVVFSITLTICQFYQKKSKFIASGKQTGTIRDMYEHLYATSEENVIILDSDIKGADTSTQQALVQIPMLCAFNTIQNNYIGANEFLFATKGPIEVIHYHEDGSFTSFQKELNAIQTYFIKVQAAMRSVPFLYIDGNVVKMIIIPSDIFWSGMFSTASTHNTNFDSLTDIHTNRWLTSYVRFGLRFFGSILGDDLSIKYTFNYSDLNEIFKNVDAFNESFIDLFHSAGYEVEPETSRYKCTFLQQVSFCGKVRPKPARLSIYCAESRASRDRNPFAQLSEFGDILSEYSARCPFPIMTDVILTTLWIVNSEIKIYDVESSIIKRFYDKLKLNKDVTRFIEVQKDTITFIIPFVTKYLPNVNGTKLPKFYYEGATLTPSYYSPKGSITYWMLSKIFLLNISKQDYQTLKERYINHIMSHKIKTKNEKQKQVLSDDLITIPNSFLINYEKLSELGFTFGQWLYENQDKRPKMTKEELQNPHLKRLFSIGTSKLSSVKKLESIRGLDVLREANINIPVGITYIKRAETRIQQAIETKKYDVSPKFSKKLILLFLRENFKSVTFKIPDLHMIDFDFKISKHLIQPKLTVLAHNKTDLSPCLPYGSNGFFLQELVGTPFDDVGPDVIMESLKVDLPIGASPEMILKEGIKIYKKDKSLLVYYYNALGLRHELHDQLTKIIELSFKFGNMSWKSIIQTRKFFFFSTNSEKFEDCFLKDDSNLTIRSRGLQYVIIRDLILSFLITKRIKLLPKLPMMLPAD